ncbi:MAG: ATP-dependent RNA helicase HrpA, partial [Gammaproteobacteria bacterium]|nr:ATP-dependent RNA helicase HrpA [Gammaproteobacteria bacterium]
MIDRQMLPILEQAETIQQAVAAHQVVVVCGETGSGKSTQLPQLMRAMGRGADSMIGHTQPRRIAARALATRIAEECGSPLGELVGYRVRFSDQTSPQTRIKLLTDGMLLAETSHDPQLKQYDTLIIDEAHERSLTIDFLLGYLKRLLPTRPDLRVIITSATIDPQRFSEHFDQAPIIEVSGRTWPVEVRYRPPSNLRDGVIDAVDELARCGRGDILVFLPGEREIRQCAESLRKQHLPHTEVVPLFGRLSVAEQQRVFAPHHGRRIVLATNVAETSLTVPGIRYVVDSGLARISRYSFRTRIQRLPVEPVSQASALQRSGRCGREGPGVCIRLYEESDFTARPVFTEPEILRTNLASVILQMKHLRLGEIDQFPFVEAPDPRLVRDGLRLLEALEALDSAHQLTALGKKLARLPVDPRIGRMLLAGATEGALNELLVLAAALSVQDPRDRPLDHQEAADTAHAKWQDKRSDFVSLLNLWAVMKATAKEVKRKQYDAWCREHFLSPARLREWQEVHGQLRALSREMRLKENAEPADRVAIHRALLTGLLNAVAMREEDDVYRGARDLKLAIHPGSGLAKRRPRWIVAAELVETSRVFARLVAEVRPEWIEPVAKHLLKAHYHSPFWDSHAGKVFGRVDMTLYGLPVITGRKIDYARVSPQAARLVFIQDGLLGQYPQPLPDFLQHNRDLHAALEKAEAKARRRDLVLDTEQLVALYEAALPPEVVDAPGLARWLKRGGSDKHLRFSKEQLIAATDHTVVEDFPDTLKAGNLQLPLSYVFEPGDDADGVTVHVPVAALNALEPDIFEWLVPGLLTEKVMTLIRALPKRLRRHFVPVPEFASAVLEALPDRRGSLEDAVRRELRRITGVDLQADVWESLSIPSHLTMRFLVMDGDGKTLASGRDLAVLQQQWGEQAGADFRAT